MSKVGAILGLFCLIALFVFLNRSWFRHIPETPRKIVTIVEGLTAVEISKQLRDEGVLREGESLSGDLDGYLFPDTYEFFLPTASRIVASKMRDNFNAKVIPIVPSGSNMRELLIVASLVEEEVADPKDRRVVAGIIWKRLQSGMPLQIDSAICYVKASPCYPITSKDLKTDTKYNTYLYKGLPPGPIANPGLDAIRASINPEKSKYWYYISDPRTKKTIFSVTFEEHKTNVAKYLR